MNKMLKDPKFWSRMALPIFSLIMGIGLLLLKFYAYSITSSHAILSDALESIVNVVAGTITVFVILYSSKPADEDHPYGHGKLESLAASFEGGAIALAGVLVIIESIKALIRKEGVQELEVGLYLTVVAAFFNGMMGWMLKKSGEKRNSEALVSSGVHLLSDAWTSLGIIISLIVVKFTGLAFIDAIVAIFFGGYLIFSGIKILIRSGNILLDGHDEELLKTLGLLFEKNYLPGLIHIHHTRVIKSGNYHHIEIHMVIPEYWSVNDAHEFSDKYEHAVLKEYPYDGNFTIHLDPCRRVYCETCEVSDCPIRKTPFFKRESLNRLEELTSKIEKR